MKYISIIGIFLLFCLSAACHHNDEELGIANSHWLKLDDLNTTVNFHNVTFEGRYGWIVGDNGIYLSTRNSGNTWKINKNGDASLYALDFVGSKTGWMVNNQLQLYKTEDNGATWKQYQLPQHVTEIDFINSTEGWAIGSSSTIMRTRNGGESWTPQAAPTGYNFMLGLDMHFISNKKGWIAPWASSGGVLFTEDGGKTWHKQPTDTLYYATGIDFINDSEGWVATYEFDDSTNCLQGSAPFVTSVFHTVNSGQDWQRISTLCGFSGDIDFVTQRYGWIITGSPDRISVTEDGGMTWTTHYESEDYMTRLHMINPAEGWAVGDRGAVLHFSTH